MWVQVQIHIQVQVQVQVQAGACEHFVQLKVHLTSEAAGGQGRGLEERERCRSLGREQRTGGREERRLLSSNTT